MRFSFGIPTGEDGVYAPSPFAGPMQIVEVAQLAERLGFDAVWTIELTTPSTSMQIPDGEVPRWYEVLTTLAYVAARTERIALGTGVLVLPNRDPILLAKQVATLDVFSKGRVILGVGVGKYRDEFVSLHPRLANVRRAGMLEEGLECLTRLFSGCSNTSTHTSAAAYGWSCGVSGERGAIASGRYVAVGYLGFMRRLRLGHRLVCGACLATGPFIRPCPSRTLTPLVFSVLRPLLVL